MLLGPLAAQRIVRPIAQRAVAPRRQDDRHLPGRRARSACAGGDAALLELCPPQNWRERDGRIAEAPQPRWLLPPAACVYTDACAALAPWIFSHELFRTNIHDGAVGRIHEIGARARTPASRPPRSRGRGSRARMCSTFANPPTRCSTADRGSGECLGASALHTLRRCDDARAERRLGEHDATGVGRGQREVWFSSRCARARAPDGRHAQHLRQARVKHRHLGVELTAHARFLSIVQLDVVSARRRKQFTSGIPRHHHPSLSGLRWLEKVSPASLSNCTADAARADFRRSVP